MVEGYAPEKFYMDATDKRGHSKGVRFSLPPDQMYRLSIMVGRKEVPYSTVQDFIRDAIVHRLHWLDEHVPEMEPLTDVFTLAADLARWTASYEQSEKVVEEFSAAYFRGEDAQHLAGRMRETIENAEDWGVRRQHVEKLKDLLHRVTMYGESVR